ncbi:hypothetical protein [Haloarcula montana]|uniref:hypothetical protein n=1 Tax=Haloarcula montana TaxID=3111776 RepID=UPI002D76F592|nr:hypothetical protein [Haloarcula sp. GH36]
MGLFDTIRRTLGGGDDTDGEESASAEPTTETASDGPTVTDSASLSPTEFRQRAETVADRSEQLDLTTGSLSRLDAAVAEQFDGETVEDGDDTAYTTNTVRFGSYLGEVLVRDLDGRWVQDDGWGVTVAGTDDERTVAVFDVAARSFAEEPAFAAVVDRLEDELVLSAEPAAESDADDAGETDRAGQPTADQATSQTGTTDSETVEDWADAGDWQPATEKAGFDRTDDQSDSGSVADTPDELDEDDGGETVAESGDGFRIPDAEGGVAAEGGTDTTTDDDGVTASDTETGDEGSGHTDAWSLAAESASAADDRGDTARSADTENESLLDQLAQDEAEPSDPAAGDGLRADYAERAADFASFWGEHNLDFTPASLARLDDLVDAEWEDERFADATYGETDRFEDRSFTSLVEELGSYFGEVLVRELDAEWTDETDHPAAVVVTGTDGRLAVPVSDVAMGSLRNGAAFERSYQALLADLEDG